MTELHALATVASAFGPLQVDLAALASDPSVAMAVLIALPIVAAAVVLVAGLVRDYSGWPVAVVALVAEAAVAAWLFRAVQSADRLVHELGDYGRTEDGWAVGIELVADGLSAPLVVVIAAVALGVLAITRQAGPRGNAVYGSYLLLVAGLMGVVLTGDVFNLFVFLEITGLATYTLVASRRHAEAAVASLKYLIVGTTGASLYLVGVGYLFLATGTLNMVDLGRTLACGPDAPAHVTCPLYGDPLVVAGFAFVTVGLFVKAAIFPLHTWQPDAYARAPDGMTVAISALVSTAAAYAYARLATTVFTPAFFAEVRLAATAVLVLAAGSVVAGAALAVLQSDVKRTFAYSSVSQFGLIVTAVGVAVHPAAAGTGAGRAALLGAVIHLVGHAVAKGGVFAAAAGLQLSAGARRIREYAELGRDSPVLAACVAVLGLTLVGVPPTVGFLGKWYIALGAIQAELWPLAVVVLASTLLTLGYVARLLERLYFTPAERAGAPPPATGGEAGGGPDAGDHGGPSGASDPSVAADGGPSDAGEAPVAPDGDAARGERAVVRGADTVDRGPHEPRRAPLGVLAFAVVAALAVVALGFAGDGFAALLDPVLSEVFGQ